MLFFGCRVSGNPPRHRHSGVVGRRANRVRSDSAALQAAAPRGVRCCEGFRPTQLSEVQDAGDLMPAGSPRTPGTAGGVPKRDAVFVGGMVPRGNRPAHGGLGERGRPGKAASPGSVRDLCPGGALTFEHPEKRPTGAPPRGARCIVAPMGLDTRRSS